jgi:hypothetical protein
MGAPPYEPYELPIYLPSGWRVRIQYDRLVLIAPNRAIAEALRLGAAQSLQATSQRLGVPVEILSIGQ